MERGAAIDIDGSDVRTENGNQRHYSLVVSVAGRVHDRCGAIKTLGVRVCAHLDQLQRRLQTTTEAKIIIKMRQAWLSEQKRGMRGTLPAAYTPAPKRVPGDKLH